MSLRLIGRGRRVPRFPVTTFKHNNRLKDDYSKQIIQLWDTMTEYSLQFNYRLQSKYIKFPQDFI